MGRNNNNNDENRSLNISAVNFGDATHTILIYYYTYILRLREESLSHIVPAIR